jgi:two-component system sensor histidine kinase PilS (NtrC family)
MSTEYEPSWLELRRGNSGAEPPDGPREFVRLWRGFMTARVTLGAVLLLLQVTLFVLGQATDRVLAAVCAAYLVATLATRLLGRPRRLGRSFDPQWLSTIGVDVVAFGVLQYVQGHAGINYTPLLALPVLLASVLGSLPLAMGTAAGVSLLLLGQAALMALQQPTDATPLFAQTALTGAGYFLIAFLSTQLSARLANEEQRSQRSQLAVRVQRQVNELVIESMADGVLVLDVTLTVWAVNPSATRMLGREPAELAVPFDLATESQWEALGRLASTSFASGRTQHASLVLSSADAGPLSVLVRTRLTSTSDASAESLCVMFMQDQREAEARLRTEKLASMGRMSTAVAHEIRNPLAAIMQANALLDEETSDPRLRKLTQMVQQNATRLERIVDEVLNVSRVPGQRPAADPSTLALRETVARICQDWAQHTASGATLQVDLVDLDVWVHFDAEHLRRVLVNLLDNAKRYAGTDAQSIRVSTRWQAGAKMLLGVWSNGPPMDQSVQRHLFEPFFSSESRSTGLGLYICRELCEGHGASITFRRTPRRGAGGMVDGNEFQITLEQVDQPGQPTPPSARIPTTPWQQNRP